MRSFFTALLLLVSLVSAGQVQAEDRQAKADEAVANILFDNELSEYSTYVISSDGQVDILFPNNMPNDFYKKIIAEMEAHPDIGYVLAGRSRPPCKLW